MPDQPTGLLAALHAFQADAPSLQRDKINPAFRSKYLSLDSLMEQVLPVLNKHGLVWVTLPTTDEHGNPAITYQLTHVASGEALKDTMPLLLAKQDPQGLGSALTYSRRYSLMAVLGLVADADDDANAASQRKNGNALATPADVKAMLAAAQGLAPEQVKLALAACGVEDVKSYGQVPAAKAAAVAKALAGIER